MTRIDIASLAFKLAGIYALFQALGQVQYLGFLFPSPLGGTNQTVIISVTAASLGSLIASGCVLIAASHSLASWMFPEELGRETPRIRVLAVQGAAFSVIGVFFAAGALPSLVGTGVQWLQPGGGLPWAMTLQSIIAIVVGVGLFFGGHGLARLWSKLRYAGLRQELGLCVRCGYDLHGNVSGTCPECGRKTSNPDPNRWIARG
jgi:hypothetical protein